MPVDGLVVIGRLGRPHGVLGEIRGHSTGRTLGAVQRGERVMVVARDGSTQRELGVEDVRTMSDSLLFRFTGIDTREAAAELTGATIRVQSERLGTLSDPTEFYVTDLIGCVVTAGALEIGTVIEVHEGSANDSLVVQTSDGKETLIPFTRDALEQLDVPGRRIRIRDDLLPPKEDG